MKSAVVVGGGLAGLAAARALAVSSRCRVQVFEADALLGGKAASWRESDGSLVEVGLHVCFPYYQVLRNMLRELGVVDRVAWGGPTLNYLRPDGDAARLHFPRLPVPLNSVVAVARHRHLGLWDRLSALAGAAEATLSTAGWRSRYERVSFAGWARSRGFSQGLVAGLLEPIVRGLTFLRSDQVSAHAMLEYVRAVGSRTSQFSVGLFRGGSGEVLVNPLAADAVRRGAVIHRSSPVAALLMEGSRVCGVQLQSGSQISADCVILAVPCHRVRPLLPDALRAHATLADVGRLQPVPVASVMLWFDRALGGPRGARLSSGCIFNTWVDMAELLPEFADSRRSVLQLVVAPMTPELSVLDDEALVVRVLDDLRRILPLRAARVLRATVTHTRASFHAVAPGTQALRPPTEVGVPGLLLAGDYVLTGHSPNMESAVSSGLRAAGLALAS